MDFWCFESLGFVESVLGNLLLKLVKTLLFLIIAFKNRAVFVVVRKTLSRKEIIAPNCVNFSKNRIFLAFEID